MVIETDCGVTSTSCPTNGGLLAVTGAAFDMMMPYLKCGQLELALLPLDAYPDTYDAVNRQCITLYATTLSCQNGAKIVI